MKLKTNILHYTEHTLSHYWVYGSVVSLPVRDAVFRSIKVLASRISKVLNFNEFLHLTAQ